MLGSALTAWGVGIGLIVGAIGERPVEIAGDVARAGAVAVFIVGVALDGGALTVKNAGKLAHIIVGVEPP